MNLNLIGNINGDLFEVAPETYKEKFLDELQELMNKYHVQSIDICWRKNFTKESGGESGE